MSRNDMIGAIRQQLTGLPGLNRVVQIKENWEWIFLLIIQIKV